jgi:protein-disulfide isomerase
MSLGTRPRRPTPPRRGAAVGAIAAAALVGAACGSSAGKDAAAAGAPAASAAAPATNAATAGDSAALRAAADSGRILGAPQAKAWMLIVSDFECPYCKQWHDETYETLRREYVETGKVRLAYLHYPLDQHPQAVPTAEAAMCASAQGKFWPYQTALFETKERWAQGGDQSAVYDSLATAMGLDVERFRSCTRSHVMRAVIDADRDRMSQAGVRSTPSFFVGNTAISGAQPIDVFRRALDAAIASAGRGAR